MACSAPVLPGKTDHHISQLGILVQHLGYRHHVGRAAQLNQTGNVLENQLVVVAVKIRLGDYISNLVESTIIQHQTAKNRLFGLGRVWRRAQDAMAPSKFSYCSVMETQ
jgi:hypothetical protein